MKKYLPISFSVLLMLVFLTGCFALPIEDQPPPPPVVRMPQAQVMRTVAVMRGDVVRYFNPSASYVPSREEQLSFGLDGFRVLGIYVDVGDYVEEGDIVASLDMPEIQAQLTAALRQEEWVQLNISHLDRRHQYARNRGTVTSDDNARFRDDRARLVRELEILETEIEYLERQNSRRFLRAGMNGTVSRTANFTEGMRSNRLSNMVTVVDQAQSLFVARHSMGDVVAEPGDYFTLYVNREPYQAVVIDPYEFGVQRAPIRDGWYEIHLVIVGDAPVLTGRIAASLHVILDIAEDALFVPIQAVHYGSERVFVYVLNENGIREIRDVELGLQGNAAYEVISGLEEGELVVIG